MFYPYLRGRQYELIALRELAEKKLIGKNLLPIIEPIKASPTLFSFMDSYSKQDMPFGLVMNPEYGSFLHDIDRDRVYGEKHYSFFKDVETCLPVYIFNKKLDASSQFAVKQNAIAVCSDEDIISEIDKYTSVFNVNKYIIPDERLFKRGVHSNKILRADNFKKQQRNADYVNATDEFYSDDHLYFSEEGFIGFSDFSIIGDDFIEAGFAPHAVVIHMVYFNKDETLRVHHFVSNSNDGIENPAGKFKEALQKLINSELFKDCQTYAYKQFRQYYDNKIYPGLGIVKKLSIMHHLELMSCFLDERKMS